MAPITEAPFYAVPIYAGDIGTKGGLVTDMDARVQDGDGNAIPGLYAVAIRLRPSWGTPIRVAGHHRSVDGVWRPRRDAYCRQAAAGMNAAGVPRRRDRHSFGASGQAGALRSAAHMLFHQLARQRRIALGNGVNDPRPLLVRNAQRYARRHLHGIAVEKEELGHPQVFRGAFNFVFRVGHAVNLAMKVPDEIDEVSLIDSPFLGVICLIFCCVARSRFNSLSSCRSAAIAAMAPSTRPKIKTKSSISDGVGISPCSRLAV